MYIISFNFALVYHLQKKKKGVCDVYTFLSLFALSEIKKAHKKHSKPFLCQVQFPCSLIGGLVFFEVLK